MDQRRNTVCMARSRQSATGNPRAVILSAAKDLGRQGRFFAALRMTDDAPRCRSSRTSHTNQGFRTLAHQACAAIACLGISLSLFGLARAAEPASPWKAVRLDIVPAPKECRATGQEFLIGRNAKIAVVAGSDTAILRTAAEVAVGFLQRQGFRQVTAAPDGSGEADLTVFLSRLGCGDGRVGRAKRAPPEESGRETVGLADQRRPSLRDGARSVPVDPPYHLRCSTGETPGPPPVPLLFRVEPVNPDAGHVQAVAGVEADQHQVFV